MIASDWLMENVSEQVGLAYREKIRPPQDKRGDKKGFKKFDRKERRKPGAR